MFLASSLRDGSTLYVSRLNGVRFVLSPSTLRMGEQSLYVEGRFIFSGSRPEVLQLLEEIAK